MSSQDNKNNESGSIKKELVTITKGAGFSFFGSIAGKGLKFVIIAFLTRTLGASLYGIYALGLTIVNFASKITTLGLNNGALKYIAAFQGKGDNRKTKGVILTAIILPLIFSIGISLLLFLFSKNIALFFNKPILSQALKPFAISLPFLTLLSILSASTRGFKTTKYQVIGNIIVRNIIQLTFILLFYFIGYKLLGMIWAFIFSTIAGIFVLFYYLNKLFPQLTSKKIKPQLEIKKIFSVSLPLMYVGILSFLISRTDILMVGYFLPSTQVGIYQISVKIASMVAIFIGAFGSILSPIISEYWQNNKIKELNKILKIVAKWILVLSLPIFLIIVVSPNEILKIFGANFTNAVIPLLILAAAQIFYVLTFGVHASLSMTSKQNLNAIISTIAIIANIGLNYLFLVVLNMGIVGAAIATAITSLIINGFALFFSYQKLKLSPISIKNFLILIIAVISITSSLTIKNFFVNDLHYFIKLIINSLFAITVFETFVFIFAIDPKDKFIFYKILAKIKNR